MSDENKTNEVFPRVEPTGTVYVEYHFRNAWGERALHRYSLRELGGLLKRWEADPESYNMSAQTVSDFRAAMNLEVDIADEGRPLDEKDGDGR